MANIGQCRIIALLALFAWGAFNPTFAFVVREADDGTLQSIAIPRPGSLDGSMSTTLLGKTNGVSRLAFATGRKWGNKSERASTSISKQGSGTPHPLRILFVGNSLLNFNDVPLTVKKLIESCKSQRKVITKSFFVGHLEDVPPGSEIDREVGSGNYDFVVLQAAMVSSSLSRNYPQTRGIAMARRAKERGARVLLYVEWPRRGIDETEYTMNVYRGIKKASGTEIVPVCYAWNSVRAKRPDLDLWMPDGNHARPIGSFIAAMSVFVRIEGHDQVPTYRPPNVDEGSAKLALDQCRITERAFEKRTD